MTGGFVRRGGEIFRAFSDDEARVLRGLIDGLVRTIDEGAPEDEVLARLAPDAYGPEEAEATAEFAEFTRERLLEGKKERLAALVARLSAPGIVSLDATEARDTMIALNDVRLALAERIGTERLDDPALGAIGDVYDWLGWLQSGLLDSLDR